MKKSIILFLILMTCIFLFFIGVIIFKEQQKHDKIKSIENIKNTNKEILGYVENNIPTFLSFFSTDCDHCQEVAVNINKRHIDLQKVNIILCTASNDSSIKLFAKQYGLDTIKNVHFIIDKNLVISKLFNIKSIPANFIYNTKGKLMKQTTGQMDIDSLLQILH